MRSEILDKILHIIKVSKPWTNVYGLSRTLIVLATLITLLSNNIYTLFRPVAGISEYPVCSNYKISIFCLLPVEYLPLIKWVVIILLIIIGSGWRPKYTGILHFWIASSLQNTAATLDGGEQIATVLTLLLIPVTILDNRKWHWSETQNNLNISNTKIIALVALWGVRVQMAIVYFNAAIARVSNPEWIDGTAIYYFLKDPMLGVNPKLFSLLDVLILSDYIFFITWSVTIIELLLGSAILAPEKVKQIFLYLGVLLHSVIIFLFGLFSFSLIMIAGLIIAFRPLEKKFTLPFSISKIQSDKMI